VAAGGRRQAAVADCGGRRQWLTMAGNSNWWWQLWLLVAITKAKVERIREEMF